jgi:hypothetical protein
MLDFGQMGDPLRIPDDKRGSGGLASLFESPDRGWSFWIIVAVLVGVNCWFDYHHPTRILFDVLILIIWLSKVMHCPEKSEATGTLT